MVSPGDGHGSLQKKGRRVSRNEPPTERPSGGRSSMSKIRERTRRSPAERKALQDLLLRRLGEGTPPGIVAKRLGLSPRWVQRKAREWVRDGLLVDGPRGRSGRNYSLPQPHQSQGRSRVAPTMGGRISRRNDRKSTTPSSSPRTGRHRPKDDPGEFYSGARNFFYTAAVLHPGRGIASSLKETYRGFRGFQVVHHGLLKVPDPDIRRVRVTWFRRSATVRFDVFAQGRNAAQVEALADRTVLEVLNRLTLDHGAVFGKVRLSGYPDHEVLGNRGAEALLAQGVRAQTTTPRGTRAMIDASKGRAVEFQGPLARESVPAWLRTGDNVELLLKKVDDLAGAMVQIVDILKESQKPKPPPAPPVPPPEHDPSLGKV